jgi:hypothetical protein
LLIASLVIATRSLSGRVISGVLRFLRAAYKRSSRFDKCKRALKISTWKKGLEFFVLDSRASPRMTMSTIPSSLSYFERRREQIKIETLHASRVNEIAHGSTKVREKAGRGKLHAKIYRAYFRYVGALTL